MLLRIRSRTPRGGNRSCQATRFCSPPCSRSARRPAPARRRPIPSRTRRAQDWHDPNGAGNTWDYGPDEKKDFDKPRVPFELPPMKNAVKRAYRLADAQPVEVKVEEGRPRLVIERPILDPTATVVVVEIEGDAVRK
jgi:hypothetical protein